MQLFGTDPTIPLGCLKHAKVRTINVLFSPFFSKFQVSKGTTIYQGLLKRQHKWLIRLEPNITTGICCKIQIILLLVFVIKLWHANQALVE